MRAEMPEKESHDNHEGIRRFSIHLVLISSCETPLGGAVNHPDLSSSIVYVHWR